MFLIFIILEIIEDIWGKCFELLDFWKLLKINGGNVFN
jgi:hypothetical protein